MNEESSPSPEPPEAEGMGQPVHRRRPRYSGKNPRKFEHKYKEQTSDPETIAKVIASGKTPAGTHRPIMVAEILEVLHPRPGETGADCTLGYGGHARELLAAIVPGGKLVGFDADPIELPKTVERLRALGYVPENFTALRSNYAGLLKGLAQEGLAEGVDFILADLGVSSMQLDDPSRGFSLKHEGPLDMRMNPARGQSASEFLAKVSPETLQGVMEENADEPYAEALSQALAGKAFKTTTQLVHAIQISHPMRGRGERGEEAVALSVRRVFQALRIAVNEEFSALDTFLRVLPHALRSGGRVAILTFHSGEDRRVKKAFEAGLAAGFYSAIAPEVIRPTPEECRMNTRATSTKLRWAIRA